LFILAAVESYKIVVFSDVIDKCSPCLNLIILHV